jgi:chondroitin-sulfate-ABC endolyase/exolyase
MSFGSLEILSGGKPVSARASGIDGAGWDWARFAGTTAPQLPMMDLEKAWPQGSEVTRSPETFVGGLSHLGRQGVFTMVVNQTVTPEGKSLQGRRSWFFNEDRILCMASGITSDLKEYPTQTTLCQQSLQNILSKDLHPTWLDGAEIRSFPEDRTLSASSAHWFCDVQQTGYYVPKGHEVTVARRHQKSRDVNDWEDTSGDFVTAWIDHGKAPAGAEYEYLVRVRSTPQAMRETAARPPYRVLARNARAHVMWDIPGRRFGCVFFEAQAGINFSTEQEALPVCAVDRPCLLMTHAAQKDRLALSVCDPDLHLQPGGRHEPKTLRVTLRGAWRLESTRATTCVWPLPEQEKKAWIASSTAAETVLEILCEHGASYDLMLAR